MLFRTLALATLVAFVSGCASTYQGPEPDLTVRGEAAEKEIEKFSFSEAYFDQGPVVYMGPGRSHYTRESVWPMIEKISPSAAETYSTAENIRSFQLVLVGAAVALLVLGINRDGDARADAFRLTDIAAFSSIGVGLISAGFSKSAASQYNRDLRNALSPTVGMTVGYQY